MGVKCHTELMCTCSYWSFPRAVFMVGFTVRVSAKPKVGDLVPAERKKMGIFTILGPYLLAAR